MTLPPRPRGGEEAEAEEEEEEAELLAAASAARAAIARGSAPSTSPSPPVFENGAASAVTKMISVTFVREAGGEAGGCCSVSGTTAAVSFSISSPEESSSSVANEAVTGLATLGGAPPRTQLSSESTSSALAPSIESECVEAEAETWECERAGAEEDEVEEDEEEDAPASATVFSLSASATLRASLVRSFSSCRLLISSASWSGSSVMSYVGERESFFFVKRGREKRNERKE
jgi:hypothetical protein